MLRYLFLFLVLALLLLASHNGLLVATVAASGVYVALVIWVIVSLLKGGAKC